ncbi:hypothetical protein HELRODRAFT_194872 [Helobdella robusta]|uniref:CP-type G domain-containing protein n=1 Tax=Helobdella robusta TaxID=6412 RepID=T1FWI3_HELRO|nr:hypothetical protein HELRODRAFT_194872 [Helobdella robusta]ESO11270.1 hypothetical protein HELRODRAFT_194872 [Helobdella robusta]
MPRSKIGNKKSKRVACGKRYKIEKKVRQHNKKLKKLKDAKLKKGPTSSKKKDPGVPNSCPFKEEILREAQKRRDLKEEERLKRKEQRKKEREKTVMKHRNIESLIGDVEKKTAIYEKKNEFMSENASKISGKNVESSLKSFYKEVKYVIDSSDVVIEVLDSRDPLGSRCRQLEEAVLACGSNKRLVLLLNKIDLVPQENVEKWLKYLRNEFPTIPFKACTQNQSHKLGRIHTPIQLVKDDVRRSSQCLGSDLLIAMLNTYCRNKNIKTSITIGIVGFPNTGKSSIINSLKRTKACNVGSTPGVTRSSQAVQLDKYIKLLDSPGVVMATNASRPEDLVLRNCVKLESLADPIPTVSAILNRCNKQQLMLLYTLPDFKDINEFLQLVAKRYGLLKKGGLLDTTKAAKIIIKDWNGGKIRYYTEPPEQYNPSNHISLEIVSEMSREFNIDDLLKSHEDSIMQDLQNPADEFDTVLPTTSQLSDGDILSSAAATAAASAASNKNNNDDDDDSGADDMGDGEVDVDEEMEDDEEEEEIEKESRQKKTRGKSKVRRDDVTGLSKLEVQLHGNRNFNKEKKKAFKSARKLKKKTDKLADSLVSKLTTSEDYDFNEHF